MARSLSRTEVELYDHVPTDVARRARLHRVRLLPPGARGMTLGRHVLLVRGHENRRVLVAHELVHVRQFAEQGHVRFLARYLWGYLRGLVSTRVDRRAAVRTGRMPSTSARDLQLQEGSARANRHREAYLAIPAEVEARAEAERWANAHPDAA
ncbi:MAG TPA: DUF4157 domain-containing protein [Acidimicrobiales bacterium]|nr:DUF4157 domain-containing protein [Acidimicrobiales bacterium]